MRHPKRTLCLLTLLMLLPMVLLGCRGRTAGRDGGGATAAPQTQAPAAEPTATATPAATPPTLAEPTMEECRQWLASSEELTVPIACPTWSFFRDELFERGGGVFPVGDGRYYLALFPDDWETVTDRKVIVSLHGTGGCAEWMLNHWYQTSSPAHSWALVALQFYDPQVQEYDDDEVIYQNLEAGLNDLQAHCPIAGSDVFYHGFSRGAAQSFPVAIRDQAGDRLFAAFIADSGCSGLDYPTLRDAPADALAGARFWMWCGQNDVSTVDPGRMTCDVMEEDMRPYLESHGGQVDALIREEGAGHGMFSGCVDENDSHCTPRTAENLGPSLPLLFEYIEAFPELPPTAQPGVGAEATPEGDDTYTIWFIELDHGDAVLIRSAGGRYVLIDAGPFDPNHAVRTHLTSLGVETIHRAILTHPDGDHFRGFDDVIDYFAIEQFLYTGYASDNEQFAALMEHINRAGIPLVNVSDGDVIEMDNLTIAVLHPPASGFEGENEDNNSLTGIVSNRSGVDFFSGGDLGPAGLRSLSERHAAELDVELLKANHHGCLHDNPAAFVEVTSPTHAFLTNEAHPLCDVQGAIEQFQDYGIAVYNTVEHGTITV
ncbi:MAG: MBL fold metallo-hydrolase [Anaerolineae bacterium]